MFRLVVLALVLTLVGPALAARPTTHITGSLYLADGTAPDECTLTLRPSRAYYLSDTVTGTAGRHLISAVDKTYTVTNPASLDIYVAPNTGSGASPTGVTYQATVNTGVGSFKMTLVVPTSATDVRIADCLVTTGSSAGTVSYLPLIGGTLTGGLILASGTEAPLTMPPMAVPTVGVTNGSIYFGTDNIVRIYYSGAWNTLGGSGGVAWKEEGGSSLGTATTIDVVGSLLTATFSGGTGTLTARAILNADVSASAAIDLSKLANISTDVLLGRTTAGSGAIEQIAFSDFAQSLIAAADAAAVRAIILTAGSVGPTELAATAVTAGSYTLTSLTVDADGRITAASNGSIAETLAITDLSDVAAKSGTGTTVIMQGSPTITSPSLTSATINGTATFADQSHAAGAAGTLLRNGNELSWGAGGTATNLEQVGRKGAASGYAPLGSDTLVANTYTAETLTAAMLSDVTVTGLAANDLMIRNGSSAWVNAAQAGDISGTVSGNTLTWAITSGAIVNDDINASAGVVLSKLATQGAYTIVANGTGSTAVPTAFASSSFFFGLVDDADAGTFRTSISAASTAHESTHRSAGSDALSVLNLAGFPGGSTTFLRADGTFATPASSAFSGDYADTTNKVINNSGSTNGGAVGITDALGVTGNVTLVCGVAPSVTVGALHITASGMATSGGTEATSGAILETLTGKGAANSYFYGHHIETSGGTAPSISSNALFINNAINSTAAAPGIFSGQSQNNYTSCIYAATGGTATGASAAVKGVTSGGLHGIGVSGTAGGLSSASSTYIGVLGNGGNGGLSYNSFGVVGVNTSTASNYARIGGYFQTGSTAPVVAFTPAQPDWFCLVADSNGSGSNVAAFRRNNVNCYLIDSSGGHTVTGNVTFTPQAAANLTEGALIANTTRKALLEYTGGVTQTIPGVLFTVTSDVTTTVNSTNEISLIGASTGVTATSSSTWVAGKVIHLTGSGNVNGDASTPGNAVFRLKLGSTILGQATIAIPPGATSAGTKYQWEADIICVTVGASGTFRCRGSVTMSNEPVSAAMTMAPIRTVAGVTGNVVDTTAALTIDFRGYTDTANANNYIGSEYTTGMVVN